MSDKHSREPIKHTCPDIDKYIKWIKFEIVKDRDLKNMNEIIKAIAKSSETIVSGKETPSRVDSSQLK
mgnify:CR=1 FL=1